MKFLLCVSVFLFSCNAWADMYSALQYVYDNNPIIGQARAELDMASANIDSSKTDLQPYLGLAGNVGMARTTALGYDFDYVPMQYGVEFQQNVFRAVLCLPRCVARKCNMKRCWLICTQFSKLC